MTTVHSSRWYRVAQLKPRLSPRLQLRRQRLRGEIWYLLTDPAVGRSVRLNGAAYALAGRLDGRRTVEQLWEWSMANAREGATQDELIDLLVQLREASLVQFDRTADFDLWLTHLDQLRQAKTRRSLLAWRIPLGDPSALLDRLQGVARVLFSRAALTVWLLAVLSLVLLVLQHGPQLLAHAQLWLATPRYATLALLLFVPIKLLHELSHGLAVRRWGGRVREAGVTLMLLMPVPYVDASAATSFGRRRQRLIVSAAGIMAELALAALALPLWLGLDDGWGRDAAFVTLVMAGVSTVLFNGNPLQRLDGYYLMTDALDLPNLATRSRRWWLQTLRQGVLRVPVTQPMALAPGEAAWLVGYAPLAWLYQLAIGAMIVVWLGRLSMVLGLLSAALVAGKMLCLPLLAWLGQMNRAAMLQSVSARRWRQQRWGATLALALLVLWPMPDRAVVQGVVWPADSSQLRADESGLVEAVLVHDGQDVQPGDAVLKLLNPQLQSSYVREQAHLLALQARLYDALPRQALALGDSRAGDARLELAAAQTRLTQLEQRLERLVVRARVGGRVALPLGSDTAGQFVHQGSLIGQVLTPSATQVRVALAQAQALDLSGSLARVSVSLSSMPGVAHQATVVHDSGGAVAQLPSAALSHRHGGDVATDPGDPDDLKPLQAVVLLDVRLFGVDSAATSRIGERAWVRFDLGRSALLMQGARWLRQQVLARFNPQV